MWSRQLPAEPSSVTIIRHAAGRYFASFVLQTADEPLPELDTEVGIDLGLTHFAVLSDGTKAARAPAKVADTRRDWQHKLSTTIIRDNQAVYVEDLCVIGLGRTRLAKSVHDAGWASFVGMVEYKAARHGRNFRKIDRFAPTSQTCSVCGWVDGPKPLNVRIWTCPCGAVHDRNVNAAINVLAAGRAESLNACGVQVRPAPVSAPRREAGIPPGAARSAERIPVR
ncbi:RNA-guided endonuclease InsQ/TnpB family protein [Planosporangium sp. 12N6]|uniref:RNA-guided endonuclease InsQ/TnpB family protein n=1 Tax=Planosporangium spinosum TaxID=3402278 RepID=UPI003CF774A1